MAQATTPTYRILTRRQRHRRTWRTIGLTSTHQVAFDPDVYIGTLYPVGPTSSRSDVDVIPTGLGHDLGLVRRAS